MKRRTFLKYSTTSLILPSMIGSLNAQELDILEKQLFSSNFFSNIFGLKEEKKEIIKLEQEPLEEVVVDNIEIKDNIELKTSSKNIVKKDMFIEEKYITEFISVKEKLTAIQRYVGYGNFNILSFDNMIRMANNSPKINSFTKKELDFLEFIFYYNPSTHGFFGEKISREITETINKNDIVKIPYSGHYLFKGESFDTYTKMSEDIGDSLILTSGIRSVVKQTKLFLDKLASVDGNLTIASKSLAPPAYTYHAIGDFDVGKKGFGYSNFTSRFALTQEFLKMRKLKYIDMRYTINNKDGVRYEPWHIKVV